MSEYEGENRRKPSWHLDPTFTIGQILTIIGCFVSMIFYIGGQDTRISLVEQAQTNHEKIDAEREERAAAGLAEIKTALRRIEDKIDGKADK